MTRLLIIGPPFRTNVGQETPLGVEAAKYLDDGAFVPDHLTTALVKDRLLDADVQPGFLLDGFPRAAPQIMELDNMLASQGHPLDAVVELRAPDSELEQRMLQRAKEQGRKHDIVEVFRRRLDLYHRETHEAVAVYAGRGKVVSVEGSGAPCAITERAIAAVEKFLAAGVNP
ncbi:nucleoside monophosphate kinase [Arthrobacter sp. UYCo732]|uniref:nucleoside monophosphate kinase n=1 Tax=Arthrobacter sp. UYCo732 TaxID=3156336 RepID=UPI003399BBFF